MRVQHMQKDKYLFFRHRSNFSGEFFYQSKDVLEPSLPLDGGGSRNEAEAAKRDMQKRRKRWRDQIRNSLRDPKSLCEKSCERSTKGVKSGRETGLPHSKSPLKLFWVSITCAGRYFNNVATLFFLHTHRSRGNDARLISSQALSKVWMVENKSVHTIWF